jgi:hypothetical protein
MNKDAKYKACLKRRSLGRVLSEQEDREAEQAVNRSEKLPILKKPLTMRALKRRADKDGRISVNIAVSLDEVMTDIESFNDLADEKVLDLNSVSGSLSDITYNVVGAIPAMNKDGSYRNACTGGGYLLGAVIVNVNADVGDIINE